MSFDLYVAVLDRKGYIVGDANANSGLHVLSAADCAALSEEIEVADAAWQHYGWNNVRCFGFDIGPQLQSLSTCFLAGGNGVLASTDLVRWRVTTDWQITEVLDVVVGAKQIDNPPFVFGATAYGPVFSADFGLSWQTFGNGLENRSTGSTFCSSIAARADGSGLVLGTEDGLFEVELLEDVANSQWWPAGPRGICVRCLVEDPFRPGCWLAATDGAGLHELNGEGAQSEHRSMLDSSVLYSVACSTLKGGLIATAGFDPVLRVSGDSGRTFEEVPCPNATVSVHALMFDPVDAQILWVGTTDAGVFRVDLSSGEWMSAGLRDASIRKLLFVPSNVFRTDGQS